MARNLNYTVDCIFTWMRTANRSYTDSLEIQENNRTVYLEVPINSHTFELPCFAQVSTDMTSLLNSDTEALTISLNTINRIPCFSTIGAYMKEVLMDRFKENRLVKLITKNADNTKVIYYATFGAIFDASFKPLLMCSWLVERDKRVDDKFCLKHIKPIVRIDPKCYIRKDNPIEKFIAGKFIQTVLGRVINNPNNPYDSRHVEFATVEIAKCPFNLKLSEKPSISTTNEELLKIAEEHIDEIIE